MAYSSVFIDIENPQYSGRSGSVHLKSLIDLGGAFGAPAIIGVDAGRHDPGERVVALERLIEPGSQES